MKIYLVGGAVRDSLLHRPVTERDWVVTGATPEQMQSEGFKPIGKDFPVFLHPKTQEEYALARTERKHGVGYKGFKVFADPSVTLEEDLSRRDITINAMAMDETGQIIDPFGGLRDLEQKSLHHVSEAFVEDPVRILRVARFAARYHHLGFTIAADTLELMQQMTQNGEVDHLVPERVWQELFKALQEQNPSIFIQTLRNCGALAIILPELNHLYGIPNPANWHPEIDTGIHIEMVIDAAAQLSDEPIVRFAALMHDLGKALSPPATWPKHHGHGENGVELINNLCLRIKVPTAYKELAILVSRYHCTVHRIFECKAQTILDLLEKTDAFRRPERFQQFLLACMADFRGRLHFATQPYPQLDYLKRCFTAANELDAQPFLKQGLTGPAIARALSQARCDAIAAIKPH